ncbi:hypothetical protein ScPMuIL_000175 [Solemya velum]
MTKKIENTDNSSDVTIKDLEWNNAHNITDLIVSCTWGDQDCRAMFRINHLKGGVCFTINDEDFTEPPMVMNSAGSSRELVLVLNVEQHEYVDGFGEGVKLSVHGRDIYPSMDETGYAISTDTHAIVDIHKTLIDNLEKPYGQCEYVPLRYFNYEYTTAACREECEITAILETCKCVMPYMPRVDAMVGLPDCSLYQHMECVFRIQSTTKSTYGKCKCPTPCKDVMFQPSISYATLSVHYILQNNSDEDLYMHSLSRAIMIRTVSKDDFDYLISTLELLEFVNQSFSEISDFLGGRTILFKEWINRVLDSCAIDKLNLLDLSAMKPNIIASRMSSTISDFRSYILLLLNIMSNMENSSEIFYNISINAVTSKKQQVYEIASSSRIVFQECVRLGGCDEDDTAHEHIVEHISNLLDEVLVSANEINTGVKAVDNEFLQHSLDTIENYSSDFIVDFTWKYNTLERIYNEIKYDYSVLESICDVIQGDGWEIDSNIFRIKDFLSILNDDAIPKLDELYQLMLDLSKNRTNSAIEEAAIRNEIKNIFNAIDWLLTDFKNVIPYLFLTNSMWISMNNHFNEHPSLYYSELYDQFEDTLDDLLLNETFEDEANNLITKISGISTDIGEHIREIEKLLVIDENFYRRNFVHLSVSMKEMSYTHIKQQKAYDIYALISDIGGLIGLFIGGSIVSLFELMDFLTVLIYMSTGSKCHKRSVASEHIP